MKQNVYIFNRFEYHLDDCDCIYCLHSNGKKQGCTFNKCLYDDIKQDATEHKRIERERGFDKWDS